MDNNEKVILVPKIKDKKVSFISIRNDPKKLIILLLIIITALQFFVIIALLLNGDYKTEEIGNYNNVTRIKGRLFIYKEDNNTLIQTNKTKIHIVMAFDDKSIYQTLVSITSALENNNKNKNILIYHCFIPYNFKDERMEYIESLKEKYDFRINYYKIPNLFKGKRRWNYSYTIYYKLLIPLIFPDYDRMIYLDSDTLIFKDISEMFNLPFNDNYVLGYPFHTPWIVKRFGIFPKIYINGGVLLFNINKIRNDNKDFQLIDFTMKNAKQLFFLEQDSMNIIFHKKIGLLPLKYGVYLYGNITNFKKAYAYKLRVKLDLKELEQAIENPSIIHLCCCNPKVWFNKTKQENHFNHICKKYQKLFYFYANKTKYYNEIYNLYMK